MGIRDLKLPCSNCGELLRAHCEAHMIPCCPGKCAADIKRVREVTGLGLMEVRDRIARLMAAGYPGRDAIEALIAQGPSV